MAFVARSRTNALGSELAEFNPNPPGWATSIDTNAVYHFNRNMNDHSGYFQRDVQYLYWDTEEDEAFLIPLYRQLLLNLGMADE